MLHLGCEIEFISRNRPHDVGFAIHDEYYGDMYEINSFHATGETVVDLVHQLRDHIKAVMGALAPYNVIFEHTQQIAGGFGFTGIHLHIQDDEHIPVLNRHGYNKARELSREVVGRIARHRGLSLRQLASHHIWGGRVASDYHDWKNNSRFNPVLYNTQLQTYELRCIDFDMLLPDYQRRLINVLKGAFNMVEGAANKKCKVYNTLVSYLDIDRVKESDHIYSLMKHLEGTGGVKEWLFSPHETEEKYVFLTHRLTRTSKESWALIRERRTVCVEDVESFEQMMVSPKISPSILQEEGTKVMRGEIAKEPPATDSVAGMNGEASLAGLIARCLNWGTQTNPVPNNREALLQTFVHRVDSSIVWDEAKQKIVRQILRTMPIARGIGDIHKIIENVVMSGHLVRLGYTTAAMIRDTDVEWGTEECLRTVETVLDKFHYVEEDDKRKVEGLVMLGHMSRWEFSYIFALKQGAATPVFESRTQDLLEIMLGSNRT